MDWLKSRLNEPTSMLAVGGVCVVIGFGLPLIGGPTQASGWLIVIGALFMVAGFFMREKAL